MNKLIYILGIICCVISLYAQEEMTIEKAISIGLEENFQIKINEANIRIAENNNSWSRAGRGPVIDLNGQFSATVINDNNPASFITAPFMTGSLGGSLDANWVLLSGGRVAVTKDQLGLAVRQLQQLQSVDSHNVIREIILAYYNVLFQQERLTVLEQLIDLSKDRLEYEQVKKDFGASNSFNMLQFEDAFYTDSTNLVIQINEIEVAKRNLNTLLSIPADKSYSYPETLSVELEDLDDQKLKDLFYEQSPTLRSLQLVSELNALNEQLENSARKPSLSVNASVGLAENYFKILQSTQGTGLPTKGLFSNSMNAGVGANLNWNLYDGGVVKSNIENAKIQQEINELDVLQTTLQLTNELDVLLANYNNQKTVLLLIGKQLDIAKRNIDIAGERFKLGQISSLDYRTIQIQYLNVAFAKANSIFSLLQTKTEIDWLVGVFEFQQ